MLLACFISFFKLSSSHPHMYILSCFVSKKESQKKIEGSRKEKSNKGLKFYTKKPAYLLQKLFVLSSPYTHIANLGRPIFVSMYMQGTVKFLMCCSGKKEVLLLVSTFLYLITNNLSSSARLFIILLFFLHARSLRTSCFFTITTG